MRSAAPLLLALEQGVGVFYVEDCIADIPLSGMIRKQVAMRVSAATSRLNSYTEQSRLATSHQLAALSVCSLVPERHEIRFQSRSVLCT